MSYNGSGTFQINTSGQPVVAGTVISSTAFNALTADLATGLSTAITKDGQTTTTARIPFAAGINSSLTTDSTNSTSGSIITAGGVGIAKALYVGTTANVAGAVTLQSTLGVTGVATFSAAPIYSSLTASSAVATDASKALVSVTNTGTGNNVLATSPTLVTPVLGAASATSITVAAGTVSDPAITTTGDTNTGIFFPAADTIAFSEGGVEAMRIDSDGDVGIGTSSPAYPLTLGNNKQFGSLNTGGAAVPLVILNSSNSLVFGDDSANTGTLTIQSRGNTQFNVNGSERMRIDSSGNLLVGDTAANGRIYAKSATANSSSSAFYGTNSSATLLFQVRSDGAFNTGTAAISPYNNTTGSAANLFQGSDGFLGRSTSSIKYKTDVHNATHGLAKVMQLRPVLYKGINDGEKVFGGFIAEEVDALGLTEFVQYADDGSPDALAYGNMVSLLAKAIQEQQALIQSLTTRISALEQK